MRPILIALATVNAGAAIIWIGSIYVRLPQRYAMLWIAIAIGILSSISLLITEDWFGYLGISNTCSSGANVLPKHCGNTLQKDILLYSW